MTDVSGLYSLLDSLVIGSYVKMLDREVLSDKIQNKTRTIPVPRSRNMTKYISTPWYPNFSCVIPPSLQQYYARINRLPTLH